MLALLGHGRDFISFASTPAGVPRHPDFFFLWNGYTPGFAQPHPDSARPDPAFTVAAATDEAVRDTAGISIKA